VDLKTCKVSCFDLRKLNILLKLVPDNLYEAVATAIIEPLQRRTRAWLLFFDLLMLQNTDLTR
jgi:hypothetical protein